jgi:hypothetical protein
MNGRDAETGIELEGEQLGAVDVVFRSREPRWISMGNVTADFSDSAPTAFIPVQISGRRTIR